MLEQGDAMMPDLVPSKEYVEADSAEAQVLSSGFKRMRAHLPAGIMGRPQRTMFQPERSHSQASYVQTSIRLPSFQDTTLDMGPQCLKQTQDNQDIMVRPQREDSRSCVMRAIRNFLLPKKLRRKTSCWSKGGRYLVVNLQSLRINWFMCARDVDYGFWRRMFPKIALQKLHQISLYC